MLLSIFILAISLCALFFYKKFTESEKAYYELHLVNLELENDNKILTNRINDLELYRNDISKTVYLLDNEIKKIRENEYLNSLNDNTLVMDKNIIETLINEMPEIYEEDKNIDCIGDLKDINSLNYEKYKI